MYSTSYNISKCLNRKSKWPHMCTIQIQMTHSQTWTVLFWNVLESFRNSNYGGVCEYEREQAGSQPEYMIRFVRFVHSSVFIARAHTHPKTLLSLSICESTNACVYVKQLWSIRAFHSIVILFASVRSFGLMI